MQEFIQTYLNKLDVTAIIENILTKLLSLLFLFLLFYIAKKLLRTMVQRIVKPSLKMSRHDVGRQKTISRLLENVFNYTLYFFLLYKHIYDVNRLLQTTTTIVTEVEDK